MPHARGAGTGCARSLQLGGGEAGAGGAMPDADYYATLNVPRDATDEDLDRARKQANKLHPDRSMNTSATGEAFAAADEVRHRDTRPAHASPLAAGSPPHVQSCPLLCAPPASHPLRAHGLGGAT